MFIIRKTAPDEIEWPVSVEMPASGGSTRKYEFMGVFKRLNGDEKDALDKEIEAQAENDGSVDWLEQYLTRTMKVMVGWKDVVDENKEPLPYTRETLRAAVRAPSGAAFIAAVNRAIAQLEHGAKAKN
ncbi:MAG TPA: hypothetical protein VEC06_08545 [Paucimonas sp.]|nr:hypothetical protein [Paucimonas sp.]